MSQTAIVQITQKELAAKNINTSNQELIFDNLVFAKGPSFSFECREPALKYCQQMAKANIKSLLIEVKYGFTIWTQSRQTDNQYLNQQELHSRKPSGAKTRIPLVSSNKSQGKYRGQVNEISTQNNQDAVKKHLLPNLLRKKYRGQYLE